MASPSQFERRASTRINPRFPSLDAAENPELRDFKRRFAWTLPLTVIVTVLAMAGHRLQWFDMATQVFPTSFVAMRRVAVYFETAAVIISLTLLGQILELKARSQTSAAIKSLLGLAPKTAGRINADGADGAEEDIPITHVHIRDTLRVRPGEKVPVDGVLVEGTPGLTWINTLFR